MVPRAGARWLIDAGPFLITVHGTTFTAAWDGEREQLDIRMKHGLVSVSGPVADGKIAVRAGQRLTINVPEREVLLRPERRGGGIGRDRRRHAAAGAAPPRRAVEPSAPEAPPAVGARVPTGSSIRGSTARAAVAVRASAPSRSWTAALAAGDFQAILLEAEHRGLRRSLGRGAQRGSGGAGRRRPLPAARGRRAPGADRAARALSAAPTARTRRRSCWDA